MSLQNAYKMHTKQLVNLIPMHYNRYFTTECFPLKGVNGWEKPEIMRTFLKCGEIISNHISFLEKKEASYKLLIMLSIGLTAAAPRLTDTITDSAGLSTKETKLPPAAAISINKASSVMNPARNDSTIYLAVTDFSGRGIDSVTAIIFSDRFRNSLIGGAKVKVFERSQMNLILQEQGFQKSGACDYNSCLVEIGQLLGIQFIVAGTIGKIGDIFTFDIRMINVQSGEIINSISKDVSRPMQEVLHEVIPQLAGIFYDEVTRVSSATLEVQTIPEKATVLLNNKEVGFTPLLKKDLNDGTCLLDIRLNNFKDVRDTLQLKKGKLLSKLYTMQITDSYARVLRDKRKKIMVQSTRGACIAGCIAGLAVGGYYEWKLSQIYSTQDAIINEYNHAGSQADFQSYRNRYNQQVQLFNRYKPYRSLGYIAAAVCAAGVTVSFLF